MDFTVELLQRLEEEEGSDQQSLTQLVEAAYNASLKPWHGWISSAASKVRNHSISRIQIFVRKNSTCVPTRTVQLVNTHNFYKLVEIDRNEAHT